MPFWQDLKRPFNLVSTVIAVVSLLLSIYFYFEAKQRREPYYVVHPTNQIYSKSNPSPKIRLLDDQGASIPEDVYLLEVSFWNNGRLAIEAADVRVPVLLEMRGATRILDATVARENVGAVSEFRIARINHTSNPKSIEIQWKHLDPGLGARIQIIYSGNAQPEIAFSGRILDASIENGAGPIGRFPKDSLQRRAFDIGFPLAFTLSIFSMVALLRRVPAFQTVWAWRVVSLLVVALIGIGLIFGKAYFIDPLSAPI